MSQLVCGFRISSQTSSKEEYIMGKRDSHGPYFKDEQTAHYCAYQSTALSRKILMRRNKYSITTNLLLTLCYSAWGTSHAIDELFTFSCLPLTVQWSDPIVSPGKPSSHTHVVSGGTAFQRLMTTETAKLANDTTCGVEIDKSNYWIPQLYHQTQDGPFKLIEHENNACYIATGQTTSGS
jgi:hypothetical protein